MKTEAEKEELMDEFLKSQEAMGLNMAVMFYMIDALRFFKNVEMKVIQLIAHEIAWLGQHGYNPKKGEYKIRGLPGKTFTGYHILAYYYVSVNNGQCAIYHIKGIYRRDKVFGESGRLGAVQRV